MFRQERNPNARIIVRLSRSKTGLNNINRWNWVVLKTLNICRRFPAVLGRRHRRLALDKENEN
jgi:hypothetical protein